MSPELFVRKVSGRGMYVGVNFSENGTIEYSSFDRGRSVEKFLITVLADSRLALIQVPSGGQVTFKK